MAVGSAVAADITQVRHWARGTKARFVSLRHKNRRYSAFRNRRLAIGPGNWHFPGSTTSCFFLSKLTCAIGPGDWHFPGSTTSCFFFVEVSLGDRHLAVAIGTFQVQPLLASVRRGWSGRSAQRCRRSGIPPERAVSSQSDIGQPWVIAATRPYGYFGEGIPGGDAGVSPAEAGF